jgi:pimeloyl-ACP methyl ester carboxylesterase
MPTLELTAGPIDYTDTGGDGPVVVLLHGLVQSSTVWRHVITELGPDFRCVAPTLPFGAHRTPMKPNADLSLRGLAAIVAEVLDRLDLTDVTLVGNDWGGAQLLIDEDRVGRLVLVACEAFDNYPPGLPGNAIRAALLIPGGFTLMAKSMALRPLRRLPVALGWLTKRPIPGDVVDAWFAPFLTNAAIRRDVKKYVKQARKREMVAVTERMRTFDRPALVVWATEDRIMPRDHGRRLADLLPQGELVEIADSYTVIPEDQPAELAKVIREFVTRRASRRVTS